MSLSIPYGELEQKYEDAKAAIERVRELHKKGVAPYLRAAIGEEYAMEQGYEEVCVHCYVPNSILRQTYPCPTIKALEGTDEHTK